MADLNTAIDLCSNTKNNEKTLSLALTQRGILNRFLGTKKKILYSMFERTIYFLII